MYGLKELAESVRSRLYRTIDSNNLSPTRIAKLLNFKFYIINWIWKCTLLNTVSCKVKMLKADPIVRFIIILNGENCVSVITVSFKLLLLHLKREREGTRSIRNVYFGNTE